MSINVSHPAGALITASGTPTRSMATWISVASDILRAVTSSGTTADRPTKFLYAGRTYFDTTLGKPIWYDGSAWVDATGAAA